MAFGNFADLSSYRRRVDQPTQSPIDSFIQGLQQGRAIRQLPQEDVMNQIQLQLAQAKLRDALNPEEAVARRFRAELGNKLALDQLNPQTGVVQSPDVLGTLGNTPIATPSAITPEQQAAIVEGGISPETLPLPKPGAPITPISVAGKQTGFSIDPNLVKSAEENKLQNEITKATEIAKAKAAAAPPGYEIFTDNLGNVSYIPKIPGKGDVTPVLNASGEQLKGKLPKGAAREVGIGTYTASQAGKIQDRAINQYDLAPEDFTSLTELNQKVRELDRATGGLSPQRLKDYTYLDHQISMDPVIKAKRVSDAKLLELQNLIHRWGSLGEEERKANLDQAIQDLYVNVVSQRSPTIAQVRSNKDYAPASQKLEAIWDKYISQRGGIYDKSAVEEIANTVKALKAGGDEAAKNQINDVFGNEIIRSGFDPKEFTGEKKVSNKLAPSEPEAKLSSGTSIKVGRFEVLPPE